MEKTVRKVIVIYINDLPECVEANTYLFADDTKIFREIKTEEDRKTSTR